MLLWNIMLLNSKAQKYNIIIPVAFATCSDEVNVAEIHGKNW